ncbi:MAG: tRNA lysidine(34) synthetase TilS [Pseudomonadota bacterium]|nr:tRNA lysidine(34) synthetase TilS [Pseudomonadota bacterium]
MNVGSSPNFHSEVSSDEFEALMTAVGPFEHSPHLAVGCSGGADSLALVLLLDKWTKVNGGRVTALIVDHGIREESHDEAFTVKSWLAERGLESEILCANITKSTPSLQNVARSERYRLMGDWCRERGVLHLCVGHQKEDQAETLILNLMRGSGIDGLASMAPIAEREACRILRPLLSVPKSRLIAYLRSERQTYVKDPSNEDMAFKRVRIRALLPELAREGGNTQRLFKVATRMAEARAALEDETAVLMAESVVVLPEGYARLNPQPILKSSREVALRALGRVLRTVGGKLYAPRGEQLVDCYESLVMSQKGERKFCRTLCGCQMREKDGSIFIYREQINRAEISEIGQKWLWDGRFLMTGPPNRISKFFLADGQKPPNLGAYIKERIPIPFWQALPLLTGLDGEALVPNVIGTLLQTTESEGISFEASFQPRRPLSEASFGTKGIVGVNAVNAFTRNNTLP